MLHGIQAACWQASAGQCAARAYLRLRLRHQLAALTVDHVMPTNMILRCMRAAEGLAANGNLISRHHGKMVPLLPVQTKDAAYAHDQLSKCEEHTHTLRTQLQQVTAERDSEHHLRQQAEARTAPQHSLPQLAESLARVQQVSALSTLWRCFCQAAMVH